MKCSACGGELSTSGQCLRCTRSWDNALSDHGIPAAMAMAYGAPPSKPKVKAKYTCGHLVFDLEADTIAGIFEQELEIAALADKRDRKRDEEHERLRAAIGQIGGCYARTWCCYKHQRQGFRGDDVCEGAYAKVAGDRTEG